MSLSPNNEKNITKHVWLSAIYKPISMIISLIYVPVFLTCLGEEKYGVWVTISSFLSWLTNFDVGIGNGLRNKLAEYYAKDDKTKSQQIVSTSYCILGAISSTIFVLFFIVSRFLDLPHFMNIELDSEPVEIVLVIAAACVCLNFVLGLCANILFAIQEASLVSLKGIVVQLAQLSVALLLSFFSNSSLIMVAFLYGVSECFVNVAFSAYIFVRKKYLFPRISKYRKENVSEIVSLGIKFFVLQICSLVIYSTDNIIISKYIGSSSVTSYSIVHNIFTVAVVVHSALNQPMWSAYTAANVNNNYGWMKQGIRKMLLLTSLLSVGVIIAIPMFKPVAKLWLHKELYYATGLITLEAVYTILSMYSNTFSSVLSGVNYVDKVIVLSCVQAIINVPLSIFLTSTCGLGIIGVKIGSVISIGMSAILNPIWVFMWFKKKNRTIQ